MKIIKKIAIFLLTSLIIIAPISDLGIGLPFETSFSISVNLFLKFETA